VAVVAGASMVFAAWTTGGGGSAYGKATTSQALTTVDVSASTTATLYPGATGDALIKISNPNPFPVTVTAVAPNGTSASIAPDGGHGSRTTTGLSFNNQTGLTINVPAQNAGVDGTVQKTLNGAVAMDNTSSNGCQGATFTIPVTLTGTS